MHTLNLTATVASHSQVPHREPEVGTVSAAAGAAIAIAGPTLVALTRGWDYRLAVLIGTGIAAAFLVVGRRTVPASDVRGRLGFEFATAFAATLLATYISEWLDWRPLGIDDALAGLAVGLVFVVAGPVRRALHLSAHAPGEATFALQLLVVAPAVAPLLGCFFGPTGAVEAGHGMTWLAAVGTPVALGALGMAFALRHRLHESMFSLSLLCGLTLFALFSACGASQMGAAAAGALACGALSLVGMHVWRRGARCGWQPGSPLPWLAIASAVVINVHPVSIAWLIVGLFGAWWWLEERPVRPATVTPEKPRRPGARRLALSGTLAVSLGVVYYAQGLLLTAAAMNATGPMVLAAIAKTTPYRVSDLEFSELLLADQYLWRDVPAPSRLVAAASPERLVQMKRTDRDRWSGVELRADRRVRTDRRTWGVGLVFGAESADGWQVAYVYPGSPAERAGVRRGDLVRAINGMPVDALGAAATPASPKPVYSTRFDLVTPGRAPRTVTIESAEYSRPALTVERFFQVKNWRVGYLVLHDFRASAGEEFLNAAARLSAADVNALVLDLRMNHGGTLAAAREIASAIGGRRVDGEVFQRIVHNERYRDRDEDILFRAPARGVLSLAWVVVITSEETCSASEAIINGLAPFLSVVTVGTTTCGKPVGMTVVEYGEYAYRVITFRVLNARGQGDYFDGLPPTCRAEDDPGRELGDPEEASLRAALHFIREMRCPDFPARAAAAPHADPAS